MREPDCILVRVGEQALKSEQVQAKWFKILQENIRAALDGAGIRADVETNPNRVFIYTGEMEKTVAALKKVFGITSMSPAWATHSRMENINTLAADIATDVLKLSGKNSFAIRAHRAGRHKFTSREVAESAGAAVKRVTNAKVDLGGPEKEIEIEVRSRKTYFMVERTGGPGGLPLGSGGRALLLLRDRQDALAGWLVARRGVELAVLVWKNEGNEKLIEWLKTWHTGRAMEVLPAEVYLEGKLENMEKLAKGRDFKAVAMGENTAGESASLAGLLVLRPLVGMEKREIERLAADIGLQM